MRNWWPIRLFAEAPLASPRIPLLKMRVPKWAVVARVLWHAGYHPEIENYRKAKHRAAKAADILIDKVRASGPARERPTEKPGRRDLVAHGYFNAMIGRHLAPARVHPHRGPSRALLECRHI